MFDTHCHLNFKAFNPSSSRHISGLRRDFDSSLESSRSLKKTLPDVVARAREVGVTAIVVPGTDVKTSRRGVEIAEKIDGIYAAVGIHPHHAMKYLTRHAELDSASLNEIPNQVRDDVYEIEKLLSHPKVVAVGEVGLDRYIYDNTVYKDYQVDLRFLQLQKGLFQKQIELAVRFKKSLILHNREAKDDFLQILREKWDTHLEFRTVFHCCEPDEELLAHAKEHHIFIGVDGDVTYSKKKQEFIKNVPLDMLVLETDSPFLLPEPLKSQKKYPNEPANVAIICKFISQLRDEDIDKIQKITTVNAKRLFSLN